MHLTISKNFFSFTQLASCRIARCRNNLCCLLKPFDSFKQRVKECTRCICTTWSLCITYQTLNILQGKQKSPLNLILWKTCNKIIDLLKMKRKKFYCKKLINHFIDRKITNMTNKIDCYWNKKFHLESRNSKAERDSLLTPLQQRTSILEFCKLNKVKRKR